MLDQVGSTCRPTSIILKKEMDRCKIDGDLTALLTYLLKVGNPSSYLVGWPPSPSKKEFRAGIS